MDTHEPEVDEGAFNSYAGWKGFYGDMVEEHLPNIPVPLVNLVIISEFVDAYNSSNVVDRSSHTDILMFL